MRPDRLEDVYELTPLQEGMLFHHLLAPRSDVYVTQLVYRLRGPLDAGRFAAAWRLTTARHPILRTSIHWRRLERPLQAVHHRAEAPFRVEDWRRLPAAEQERRFTAFLAEDRRPFRLEEPPLVRFALLHLGDRRHRFVFTSQHMVLDGWSLYLLMQEAMAVYAALLEGEEPPELPPAPPFRDFVGWLRRQRWEAAEHFWRDRLGSFRDPTAPALPAPTGEPEGDSYHHACRSLSASATESLARLTRTWGVTPAIPVIGVWAEILARLSGRDDVVLGLTAAGRPPDLPAARRRIGMFLNTVPLRIAAGDGRPPGEWLGDVQRVKLDSLEHQYAPLARIRKWSGVPRGQRVFESILVFQNTPFGHTCDLAAGGLEVEDVDYVENTHYPLTLEVEPGDRMALRLIWDRRRFCDADGLRVLGWTAALLESLAEGGATPVRRRSMLSAAEVHALGVEGRGASRPVAAAGTLHGAVAEQVRRRPDAVAVVDGDRHLTYAELDRRARTLAADLRRRGVGPEVRVAVQVPPSAELVVALLAVLRAGGTYVPLDPAYPRERTRQALADSGAVHLLDADAVAAALAGGADGAAAAEPPPVDPSCAAYVIFTSGSTGRPKGVVVSHHSARRLFTACEGLFDFTPDDAWALFHSAAFDFSVWEIWGALGSGGRLVIVPELVRRAPRRLARLLADAGVTVLNQTPTAFAELVRLEEARGDDPGAGPVGPDLRWVIFGGEALDVRKLEPWFRRRGDRRPWLANMYGITETTVHVTWRLLGAGDGKAGARRSGVGRVGRPLPDLEVRLLDRHGRPVPDGVPGEICVAGDGVARGYLGRPRETALRFVPDPTPAVPGGRLYRSGDLARRHPDGDLEYLGRLDAQVKIRGFRVEPGEIEAVLASLPGVAGAAVTAHGEAGQPARLVAYWVPVEPALRPPVAALREALAERLPPHMVPALLVELESLPRTPSGKLDRRALPRPEGLRPALAVAYEPPADEAERALAEAWAEVLGLDRVGVEDDFFALGGDSILSIRAQAAAVARGVEFDLEVLFRRPTIRALVGTVRDRGEAVTEPPPLTLVDAATRAALPADVEDAYPLAGVQAGMLFHSSRDRAFYHNATSVRVDGVELDPPRLRRAMAAATARHPILRTSFDLDRDEPLQLVHRRVPVALTVVDLTALPPERRHHALDAAWAAERRRAFDVTRPPLWRFLLHRLGDGAHQLTWCEHHAILDGWSVATLLAEVLGSALGGPEPAPPAATYRGYVALEGEALESAEAERFWRRHLERVEPAPLPVLDDGGPALRGLHSVPLPRSLSRRLRAVSRRAGVPLKSLLLAVHLRVLALLTGRRRVSSGVALSTRPEVTDGDRMLGVLLNVLPLRLELEAGSWLDLVRQVREGEAAIFAHRRTPLAAIQRLAGGAAPFQAVFNFTRFHVLRGVEGLSGLRLLDERTSIRTDFPFTAYFDLDAQDGDVQLALDAEPGRLDRAAAERVGGYYRRALAALAGSPESPWEDVELLPRRERRRPVAPSREPALPTVPARIAAVARHRPEAPAVSAPGGGLTYGELVARGEAVAASLRDRGVAPGERVLVWMSPSADLVVHALGAMLAGALPLLADPATPPARLGRMAREAAVVEVLAGRSREIEGLGLGELRRPARHRPAPPPPDEVGGYAVATSGSTGHPKVALLGAAGLAALVEWHRAAYGTGPGDRVAQVASPGFDAWHWEVWSTLAAGAELRIVPPGVREWPTDLLRWLGSQGITRTFLPTPLAEALLAELAAGEPAPPALRWLLTGGDRLIRRPPAGTVFTLVNHYGPCEATVVATAGEVAPQGAEGAPSLGGALPHVRTRVVGEGLAALPDGVAGELLLGGPALARGYAGRPALTAERFVPDPDAGTPGDRLYRTGDRVRRHRDGRFDFLGRRDRQVKLRGVRVEPDEVEALLAAHPGVRQAAVVVRGDGAARRLVACVVPRTAAPADGETAVREWRELFDDLYGRDDAERDPDFDVSGWRSSQTGLDLPRGEMREWVAATLARLRPLRRRRVLEVGCGTGLLLLRLAPHAERYHGLDFSEPVVERLRRRVAERGLDGVTVEPGRAEDLECFAGEGFDLVVLHSVVQYLPSVERLAQVVGEAARALRPGGVLYLGDLRSAPALAAFHAWIEASRGEPGMGPASLRRRVERALERESELAVDPALFPRLAAEAGAFDRVRVELRRGRRWNEMTRFRYDVLLRRAGGPEAAAAGDPLDPASLPRLEAPAPDRLPPELPELLGGDGGPEGLRLGGLANARLALPAALLRWMREEGGDGEPGPPRGDGEPAGIDPEELWRLERRFPYRVRVAPAGTGEDLEVLFLRRDRLHREPSFPRFEAAGEAPLESYGNRPRSAGSVGLGERLEDHLRQQLPAALVPSAVEILPRLPLTPRGKIDRAALAAAGGGEAAAGPGRGGGEPPADDLERRLAAAWGAVLESGPPGRHDDFFELGGHSLLAVRLVHEVRRRLGCELSLAELLAAPTVARLARRLEGRLAAAGGAAGEAPAAALGGGEPPRLLPLSAVQRAYAEARQTGCGAGVWMEVELPDPDAALPGRLAAALDRLVARHEALRAELNGNGTLHLHRSVAPCRVPVVDLRGVPGPRRAGALRNLRRCLEEASAGRRTEAPFRVAGARLRGRRLRLLARLDPLTIDGTARLLLTAELSRLLNGAGTATAAADPAPSLAHSWRRLGDLEPAVAESRTAWWRQRLTALPAPLRLPRGDAGGAPATWRETLLDGSALAGLRGVGAAQGVTLSALLAAHFAGAAAEVLSADRFSFGVFSSLRPLLGEEGERVPGNFNVVLPVSWGAGDGGRRSPVALQRQMAEALDHLPVPPGSPADAVPLPPVVFNCTLDGPSHPEELCPRGGRWISVGFLPPGVELAATLAVAPGGGLEAWWQTATGEPGRTAGRAVLDRLRRRLAAALSDPATARSWFTHDTHEEELHA